MSDAKIIAVIPARYQSTRFPGKPLVHIEGKPMIQWVYEQALRVPSLDKIVVATDDPRIAEVVLGFGGEVQMTSSHHPTGTDRIAEVLQHHPCEWVLNLQGDEPLVHPGDLERLISQTLLHPTTRVATLIFPIQQDSIFHNPNVVKVVLDASNHALYFSRSPIPYPRIPGESRWKHMGIYLYQSSFLQQFTQWAQTPLEKSEQLEQLRILEQGEKILCTVAEIESIGVDTPEDLEHIVTILKQTRS